MRRNDVLGALAISLALVGAARAGQAAGYDAKAAFAETDANKDGLIEIDEYFDRLVEIFFHGDADKNGTLSPDEFAKAVVIQEAFAEVDRDGDGKVDRREFVRARLPIFQSADSDRDGALSVAEVEAALAAGSAK
jgi:Ca2+-binding EF-hand superfamily protein